MKLHIDTTSREPIYRQLVERIQLRIARGELADGAKLPSVRELALKLRINPNTVARAYRELEDGGVVVRQQGRGVFVTHRVDAISDDEKQRQLIDHLDALLLAAWRLGVAPEQVVDALRERAAGLFSDPAENPTAGDSDDV
ncbi:MAG: GntR family transcriptional regulator [Acidobacteriota bacterium]